MSWTTPTAADLPDGTVVANRNKVWVKTHPSDWAQWRSTQGSHEHNRYVQEALDKGAVVLRRGYGTEANA